MINVSKSPGRRVSRQTPTERQGRILQFIEEYVAAHGCAPSARDIATGVGLKAPSSAHYHLRILKETGYLSYKKGVPRSVTVLPSPRQGGQTAGGNGSGPVRAGPTAKRRPR